MASIFPQIEGVIAKISKSNALYPLLIALVLSIGVICIVFLGSENIWLRLLSLFFFGIVIYRIDRSYEYFSKSNPDMLRSETHVIQKQALSLIGDETHNFGTKASDVIAVLNPNNPTMDDEVIRLTPISNVQPGVSSELL